MSGAGYARRVGGKRIRSCAKLLRNGGARSPEQCGHPQNRETRDPACRKRFRSDSAVPRERRWSLAAFLAARLTMLETASQPVRPLLYVQDGQIRIEE